MLSGSRFGPVSLTVGATWAVLLSALAAGPLTPHAAADPLPVGAFALPGGTHVASALPSRRVSASASAGYGHTERLAGSESVHERAFGDVSVALSPRPAIMLAATAFGRFDAHRANGERQDAGAALGSMYAVRLRRVFSDVVSLAGDLAVLFPPAVGAGRGLAATSPAVRAVVSHVSVNGATLSANAGWRIDRSRLAVADAARLSTDDRVGAGLSASQALLLGALGSLPVSGFTMVGEWSWDVGMGRRATPALTSPMRIELGVQRNLPRGLFAAGRVGVSPSQRPKVDELVRIEPRIWCAFTFGVTWDRPPRSSAPAPPAPPRVEVVTVPPPPPPEDPEPALPAGQIRGRVRSLRGAPIKAQIQIMPLGQEHETDAAGAFAIDVPPGNYTVIVRAERYETQKRSVDVEQNGVTILLVDLRGRKR